MDNRLLFLGDWYLETVVDARKAVGQYPFVFNLEAPISTRGIPVPGKINLRMQDSLILDCFGRFPAAICLANNHIADYGNEALLDTFTKLDTLGIPFFGAGCPSDNYNNPLIIAVGPYKIALLGYVCSSTHPIYGANEKLGVAPIEIDRIQADVLHAKQCADRIVVSLHWGFQDTLLPRPEDIRKAHKIIDCGVDLIVGHHAHSPQPIETYQGKAIAYGLGNFIFPDLEVPLTTQINGTSRTYRQHQRHWNKVSWGLVWDPKTLYWKTEQYYFDGDRIILKNNLMPRVHSTNINSKYYPLRFRIHLSLHRLMWLASDYLCNPTRVRPRHLGMAVKMLFRPPRN